MNMLEIFCKIGELGYNFKGGCGRGFIGSWIYTNDKTNLVISSVGYVDNPNALVTIMIQHKKYTKLLTIHEEYDINELLSYLSFLDRNI